MHTHTHTCTEPAGCGADAYCPLHLGGNSSNSVASVCNACVSRMLWRVYVVVYDVYVLILYSI